MFWILLIATWYIINMCCYIVGVYLFTINQKWKKIDFHLYFWFEKKNLNSSVVCHLKLVEKNNVKFRGSTPNKDRQNSGILVISVALIGGNVTVVEREWLQWRIIANHQKILRSEICSNLIGTYMYGYACQVSTNQQTRQQLVNSPVV